MTVAKKKKAKRAASSFPTNAAEWLVDHADTPQAAAADGIKYLTADIALMSKWKTDNGVKSDGLVIRSKRTGFEGIRFLDKRAQPKFKVRAGQAHLYLDDGVDWDAVNDDLSIPLYDCEGPWKARVMAKLGYAALSANGLHGFVGKVDPADPDSRTEALADYEHLALGGRERVILVVDSDAAERPDLQTQLRKRADMYLSRGVIAVEHFVIPGPRGVKVDVNDLARDDVKALRALADGDTKPLPREWGAGGYQLIDFEFQKPYPVGHFKKKPPPRKYLIEGMIPHGVLSLFHGDGGIGKSFFLLDVAFAASYGGTILSRKFTAPGPVVVFAHEDTADEIDRRLHSIRTQRFEREVWDDPKARDAAERLVEKNLRVKSLVGQPHTLVDEIDREVVATPALEYLIEQVKAFGAMLSVIDPLVEIHTVDENSNTGMRQMMRHLWRIVTEGGSDTIVNHHNNKYGKQPRGATAIFNSARASFPITLVEGADRTAIKNIPERWFANDVLQIDQKKANIGKRAGSSYVVLNDDGVPVWFPAVFGGTDNDDYLTQHAAVINWLNNGGDLTRKFTREDLRAAAKAKRLALSDRAVKAFFKQSVERGDLVLETKRSRAQGGSLYTLNPVMKPFADVVRVTDDGGAGGGE